MTNDREKDKVFRQELHERLREYALERNRIAHRLGTLDSLVQAIQTLLKTFPEEKINRQQQRMKLSGSTRTEQKPDTIADAVAILIERGPVTPTGLIEQIEDEFPDLKPTMGSVTATLSYKTKKREYRRIGYGRYIKNDALEMNRQEEHAREAPDGRALRRYMSDELSEVQEVN